jgi:peptidoglycan/LPS O-acetylase OafA/YrhL
MWGEELTTFPFSQDFDAQYVVAGILERAPIPDLGWGRYLLSAVSFFLPRDLKMFPDFDPLGWSAILGNFSQSNLSLPPFTTAYFDFGLAGPALLGLALSAGFRLVDRAIDPRRALSPGYLVALVALAAYVPFLRGPILGWGAFATSGLIAAVVAGALCAHARRVRRIYPSRVHIVQRDLPNA